jgi:nucleoside-triphosphatase THEP1
LLSYKNQRYNEEASQNVDKTNTQDYLDSCIVFVYDKQNRNITSFLKELEKLDAQKFKDFPKNDKINQIKFKGKSQNNNLLSELGNIMVISSDICGLGKSEKIKKIINDNDKKYFYFPLGGILTKNVIYKKLETLFEKLKNEEYNKIAIHLDLTESKEKSIINEFFFSFLVTKFYTNNENILFIPKDISIYIEIPNCFEDYLSKFGILKIFKKENISFESMLPFNYSNDIIDIFTRILGIKSNQEIQEFVKKYINLDKYSYHQINIFIKLFISQYIKFDTKIKFLSNEKDVTEEKIKQFAQCTQYFTNGGFAQLLTKDKDNDDIEKDSIDKLEVVYDNDLERDFPIPLIFTNKEKMIYEKLYISKNESNKYKNSRDYLQRLKEILNLPNEVEKEQGELKSLLSIIEEKNNNYVITNDNFKKMVLLVYRIYANVPIIIMGDTGCGKTTLITKLNQIINNGVKTVEIINIHPGVTDEELCQKMAKKMN